ncbi:MAG: hypothetical protein MUF42_15060 [Cytophagaceae bacterium]|jgi:hypothetical protein|nr:hypothetical protein [Cytophagaceae bacterium]
MELLRNFFNDGQSSYLSFTLFMLVFIVFILGTVSLMDFMISKFFNRQQE